jgi:hypothetical protein
MQFSMACMGDSVLPGAAVMARVPPLASWLCGMPQVPLPSAPEGRGADGVDAMA